MDVARYLDRIGLHRPSGTGAADLAALHAAHPRAVPFEDYDIHLGTPLSLELDDLVDKIVQRGRGGFCYELNGLFAALLAELGFTVTLHSAFNLDADGRPGPDFEHLRLLVHTADGPLLADVGNGASWTEPVPLREGTHGAIRLHRDGEQWSAVRLSSTGAWEREWAWTLQPRELADFTARCHFQQTDPQSHFTGRRLAVLATEHGRISLVNGVFKESAGGQPTERAVTGEQERALLADRFGIRLEPDQWWRTPPP